MTEERRPTTVIVVDDAPAAGEPIDPRFRARRILVKRQAGRKRLRWFVVVGIVAVVVGAALGVARSPLLSARTVVVTGAVYTDEADLAALVDDIEGEPLLGLDTSEVTERFEALPWVKRADVGIDWPSGVRVDLVERRPATAFFAPDGRYRVIDREGRVLAVLDGQPIDLVTVTGVGPEVALGATAPGRLVGAAAVAAALPSELRAHVLDLALDDEGAVRLRLAQGGEVLLGPPDDVREKLLATLAVLGDLGDPGRVATLDVRVPAAPVLTEKAP
jgi:cell division protein FtsQ